MFKIGQTVYKKDTYTKYEIVGYWSDYLVVKGPSGYPCLRKRNDVVGECPNIIKIRFAPYGKVYYYIVESEDIGVGDKLWYSSTNAIVEVVEVNVKHGEPRELKKFVGYKLSEVV